MTTVYVLEHWHDFDDGHDNIKLIGIYSTEENAKAALARARELPGFKENPDGFELYPFPLDKTIWEEGYVTIQPGEV